MDTTDRKHGRNHVWSSREDVVAGLAAVGVVGRQALAVEELVTPLLPALVLSDSTNASSGPQRWSCILVAAAVPPPARLIRSRLNPNGLAVIFGAQVRRFDRLKAALIEHGHVGSEISCSGQIWWGGLEPVADPVNPGQALPLIVSYYTVGTPYEEEARRLIDSCRNLGLEHEVRGIPPFGSWESNCAYKPSFLRDMLRESGRPILWVDADAVVHRRPSLLAGAACDFAVHKFDRWEFASGTVFLNNTPSAQRLLDRWAELGRKYSHIWDQVLLAAAWEDTMLSTPLKTLWLPPPYTLVFDRPESLDASTDPVIVHHQASRRLKAAVTTETTIRPEPLVSDSWRRARRASRAWLGKNGKPAAIAAVTSAGYVPFPGTPHAIPPDYLAYEARVHRWTRRHVHAHSRVAIFGSSWFGARIAAHVRSAGCEPVGFFDNAPAPARSDYFGVPLSRPPASLRGLDAVIVASVGHSRAIAEQVACTGGGRGIVVLAAHHRPVARTI